MQAGKVFVPLYPTTCRFLPAPCSIELAGGILRSAKSAEDFPDFAEPWSLKLTSPSSHKGLWGEMAVCTG